MTDFAFSIVQAQALGAVRVVARHPDRAAQVLGVEFSSVQRGACLGGTARRITSNIDRAGLISVNAAVSVDVINAARRAAFPGETLTDLALWQVEHPTFPASAMPDIPAGFIDESWRNDDCPSFTSKALRLGLFIDYPEADERSYPNAPRFSLYRISAEGEMDTEADTSLHTDDWSEILAAIAERRRELDPMTIAIAAAEAAANAMAATVQKALEASTGDVAGMFFSGDNMARLVAIAEDLTRTEIAHLTNA